MYCTFLCNFRFGITFLWYHSPVLFTHSHCVETTTRLDATPLHWPVLQPRPYYNTLAIIFTDHYFARLTHSVSSYIYCFWYMRLAASTWVRDKVIYSSIRSHFGSILVIRSKVRGRLGPAVCCPGLHSILSLYFPNSCLFDWGSTTILSPKYRKV